MERELHKQILINLKKDLKENYYDPNLRGIDIEAKVKEARDLVTAAKSVEEMTDIVARVLIQFDDSHLGFIPPARTVSVDYGFDMQLYGDRAFITRVSEDSDAKKKGLRPGDQIYMFEGFIPTRSEFWLLKYHYLVLAPQPKITLFIVKPSGNRYKVDIDAQINRESVFKPSNRELLLEWQRTFRERTHQELYNDIPGLAIWKIPAFEFSDIKVDKMIDRVKKGTSAILDLRGNSGGYVYSERELVSAFFDKEVMICNVLSRKKKEIEAVKGDGKKAFTGKLVVLVDSESASAAEVFARVVQLEGRGLVIGDQTSGKVMEALTFDHYFGLDNVIGYAFSITDADLVMKDGQRLEKVGVTPDDRVVPTPLDLANSRDPVLARAAEKLGFELTAEEAGKIFARKK
ncbi:MAG: S41 family peptidase [Acidobacteriota bacterium]